MNKILIFWKNYTKKEYLIYQEISTLIETCKTIDSKIKSITIEKDLENNSILLDDIAKKILLKKIIKEE